MSNSSKYASFAPAASHESGEPTPGRRRIVTPLMGLRGVAILNKRDDLAALVLTREAARHALREQGGAG